MKQVLRQEKKYLITKSDYIKYSAAFMPIYSGHKQREHGYTVRSLYFVLYRIMILMKKRWVEIEGK